MPSLLQLESERSTREAWVNEAADPSYLGPVLLHLANEVLGVATTTQLQPDSERWRYRISFAVPGHPTKLVFSPSRSSRRLN